jgi:hypothetical protein
VRALHADIGHGAFHLVLQDGERLFRARLPAGATIDFGRYRRPAIECEVAVRLGRPECAAALWRAARDEEKRPIDVSESWLDTSTDPSITREVSGARKISHSIIPDNSSLKVFLYDMPEEYDSMSRVLWWLPYNYGDGSLRSPRGLGFAGDHGCPTEPGDLAEQSVERHRGIAEPKHEQRAHERDCADAQVAARGLGMMQSARERCHQWPPPMRTMVIA